MQYVEQHGRTREARSQDPAVHLLNPLGKSMLVAVFMVERTPSGPLGLCTSWITFGTLSEALTWDRLVQAGVLDDWLARSEHDAGHPRNDDRCKCLASSAL